MPGDDGTEIPVSTTITAPEAICLDEGVATLPIEVDGNGVGIDSVSIKFDGITEVLCDVDCGEVFTQVANLNIPEGITGLTIEVVNNAGCSDDIPVVISDTEVDLSCPENKAVLLNPDEEFLAHTDPRIAGHLDTYMVSGGCPVASVSYLPTFYSLSESPETITFSAGGESCTMELSLRRDQIAFIENETVKLHTLGGSEAWSRNFDLPVALDFDRAGNLLVVGQHIVGDSVTVLNADTGNTLSSFTGQEIIDLQVRPVEPLAIAIVEQSGEPGMPFRVRILSEEGDLGEMQFRYYPHIDWSNGGSLLLITSIDDPLGAGGVLGATVRHQLGQEQADGQYQFTMLTPDDRIDENVILDAAFIAHNNQGANIGFATTGGLFRRSGIGETVELPTDLINLAVADFRHEEPSMMGARSGSGQLDIISDADIPAIDIGAHGIAVSNWAPDRKIAVMKPLSIDIYDLSASSTPVPHGFIVPLVDSNGDQITVTTTARARSVVFRPYP